MHTEKDRAIDYLLYVVLGALCLGILYVYGSHFLGAGNGGHAGHTQGLPEAASE